MYFFLRAIPSMKLLLAFLFVIPLPYYCYDNIIIEGARDVDLENQLKILNKTPIKTIRTKAGDLFDCIDINKQPSLDHPLLKNHIVKTKPISHEINTMVGNDREIVSLSSTFISSSSVKPSNKNAILKKLSCPDGTVPIRRTSKEDLIRAKLFSQPKFVRSNEANDLKYSGIKTSYSIAKTRQDSGINYVGVAAKINLQNPPITTTQVSTAQLWIENGSGEEFNSLQAGWIVAPCFFGDNKTRLFGKWIVNGSNKSEGCYNIHCPGFVQVSQTYGLGGSYSPLPQFGDLTQYDIKVAISQDAGHNWWLDVQDTRIGYWPPELGFLKLTRGSSFIGWGGYAAQLGVNPTIPPTGNGHFPHSYRDYNLQCYMKQMKVIPVDKVYWEDPTRKIIDISTTTKECSDIIYYGHKPYNYGHTLAFGGPGGNC